MSTADFIDDIGKSEHVAHLLPDKLTEAGFWFLLQASKITATFHSYQWMVKFIGSSQWLVEDYAEFLEEEKAPFEKPEKGVSFYEIMIMQMIWADEIHFSKLVDILISYLLDVIACAYRDNPNLIPSRSRFDINFVRKFRSINDAVRGSAMVEIERVSRSGFSDLLAEAKRVAACKISESDEKEVRSIVNLRNEIVHKQGSYAEIIESMFRKNRKPSKFVKHKPGDTRIAEVTAAKLVGIFERAAIKSGIKVAARKRDIFRGVKF